MQILCVLPSLDFDAIVLCLKSLNRVQVATVLDYLTEIGLVTYSLNLGYKVPEIVRSVFLLKHPSINTDLLTQVAKILGERISKDSFTISAASGLVFAQVLLGEQIPPAFKSIVTGATLHDLVYEQYQIGMRFEGGFKKHLESAAKLAELADFVPMSNDTYETVLFYAADATSRIGGDPQHLIRKLEQRGLGAADYIKGTFAYHRMRNPQDAILHLNRALERGAFTGRTTRLLARIYYEVGDAPRALAVFERLGDERVMRDSGLLAQKIRCLRVVGRRHEADGLMKDLRRLPDDYGDYEMMQAAEAFRKKQFPVALDAIDRARAKPKVDRVNLSLLQAAIQVESGNLSKLDEACNLAIGVGRSDDALSLRARAELVGKGGWREAEQLARKVQKPNYFDKALLLRILVQKSADPSVRADPTLTKPLREEIDKLTVDTKANVEDFER